MRGVDHQQSAMFSYLSPEQRVPADHPLRSIRQITDTDIDDTQSADSNPMSSPIDSPPPDSSPACLLGRSIAASPPLNVSPSSETRCHPQSRPPPVLVSAWWATHAYALAPT